MASAAQGAHWPPPPSSAMSMPPSHIMSSSADYTSASIDDDVTRSQPARRRACGACGGGARSAGSRSTNTSSYGPLQQQSRSLTSGTSETLSVLPTLSTSATPTNGAGTFTSANGSGSVVTPGTRTQTQRGGRSGVCGGGRRKPEIPPEVRRPQLQRTRGVTDGDSVESEGHWSVDGRYLNAFRHGPTDLPPHVHKSGKFGDVGPSPLSLFYFDETAPNDVLLANDLRGEKLKTDNAKRFMRCGGAGRGKHDTMTERTADDDNDDDDDEYGDTYDTVDGYDQSGADGQTAPDFMGGAAGSAGGGPPGERHVQQRGTSIYPHHPAGPGSSMYSAGTANQAPLAGDARRPAQPLMTGGPIARPGALAGTPNQPPALPSYAQFVQQQPRGAFHPQQLSPPQQLVNPQHQMLYQQPQYPQQVPPQQRQLPMVGAPLQQQQHATGAPAPQRSSARPFSGPLQPMQPPTTAPPPYQHLYPQQQQQQYPQQTLRPSPMLLQAPGVRPAGVQPSTATASMGQSRTVQSRNLPAGMTTGGGSATQAPLPPAPPLAAKKPRRGLCGMLRRASAASDEDGGDDRYAPGTREDSTSSFYEEGEENETWEGYDEGTQQQSLQQPYHSVGLRSRGVAVYSRPPPPVNYVAVTPRSFVAPPPPLQQQQQPGGQAVPYQPRALPYGYGPGAPTSSAVGPASGLSSRRLHPQWQPQMTAGISSAPRPAMQPLQPQQHAAPMPMMNSPPQQFVVQPPLTAPRSLRSVAAGVPQDSRRPLSALPPGGRVCPKCRGTGVVFEVAEGKPMKRKGCASCCNAGQPSSNAPSNYTTCSHSPLRQPLAASLEPSIAQQPRELSQHTWRLQQPDNPSVPEGATRTAQLRAASEAPLRSTKGNARRCCAGGACNRSGSTSLPSETRSHQVRQRAVQRLQEQYTTRQQSVMPSASERPSERPQTTVRATQRQTTAFGTTSRPTASAGPLKNQQPRRCCGGRDNATQPSTAPGVPSTFEGSSYGSSMPPSTMAQQQPRQFQQVPLYQQPPTAATVSTAPMRSIQSRDVPLTQPSESVVRAMEKKRGGCCNNARNKSAASVAGTGAGRDSLEQASTADYGDDDDEEDEDDDGTLSVYSDCSCTECQEALGNIRPRGVVGVGLPPQKYRETSKPEKERDYGYHVRKMYCDVERDETAKQAAAAAEGESVSGPGSGGAAGASLPGGGRPEMQQQQRGGSVAEGAGTNYGKVPTYSVSYQNYPNVCWDVVVPSKYPDFFRERKSPGFA